MGWILQVGGDAFPPSFPQECLAARLRELNEGAVTHFRQNLNHYDETLGEVQNFFKPWILHTYITCNIFSMMQPTFTIFIARVTTKQQVRCSDGGLGGYIFLNMSEKRSDGVEF